MNSLRSKLSDSWPLNIIGAVLGSVLSLAIYHPWEVGPFDMVDFSEFLPLLECSTGFWDIAAFVVV
jgi:hypothetical protein